MLLAPDVDVAVLGDEQLRTRFVCWVASQCLQISQKKNRIALFNSLLLKSGGASQPALAQMKKSFGYSSLLSHLLFLGAWLIPLLLTVV